ncbi:ASCH domain-containing protein [Paenibacillus sp. FSL H7-0716]|uniref:2-oxoglutarate dehydrogenase E1 n=1 Tax=Paenibacillus odorifer TaxID=189426 RepID=A0AB36J583_9BACL|nr:ASCH domain-containing protein [Paenibacillus odorifer]OME10141.1 2-oxoglutarate dehydrogenase E1 [Paenibacillus odorifer]
MKAITIIQPWATLAAIGEKGFETRNWSTKHRGELAIHAGKKIDKEACEVPQIKAALARHGYTADNLPTGGVLAITNLKQVYRITDVSEINCTAYVLNDNGRVDAVIDETEYSFGWYEEGRYAWKMTDVKQLKEPIPSKGQQGLWNWEGASMIRNL